MPKQIEQTGLLRILNHSPHLRRLIRPALLSMTILLYKPASIAMEMPESVGEKNRAEQVYHPVNSKTGFLHAVNGSTA